MPQRDGPELDGPQLDGPRWGPAATGLPRQLVVLLHGVGADGDDLIGLAPAWGQALPNAQFVAPHAPEPYDMMPAGAGGPRQWFSLTDRTPARVLAGVAAASPVLDAFIMAELGRLGLGGDAVALAGFSQGAMMAMHCGLRRNPAPRAVLAYSGALIDPDGIANQAPVLLVHGEVDEVVPIDCSRQATRRLRAAGVPVETLWCAGLGHGIDQAGLSLGATFLRRAFSAG